MTESRSRIDNIDCQKAKHFASRAQYVHNTAKFKKNETEVKDAGKVEGVIQSKRELAEELGASPELIEKLYRTMIDFFIGEEMKEWKSKDS